MTSLTPVIASALAASITEAITALLPTLVTAAGKAGDGYGDGYGYGSHFMMVVMCCGCNGILTKDGQLVPRTGSVVDLERAAIFPTKEQADTAALAHGWTVADADGPNHRCPTCQHETEERSERRISHVAQRGAYIDLADLLTDR